MLSGKFKVTFLISTEQLSCSPVQILNDTYTSVKNSSQSNREIRFSLTFRQSITERVILTVIDFWTESRRFVKDSINKLQMDKLTKQTASGIEREIYSLQKNK